MKIVFFGTPDFAVATLKLLVEKQFNIAAVVTAPDKPAGRGLELHSSDVKKYAESVGLKVLQPTNLKDENFIATLQAIQADVFIIVAFRMLPKIVWEIPKIGSFNLHASLLPNYRGAAPINHAIINGETETGVTTFLIDEQIDTGAILLQKKVAIAPTDNAGILYDKLKTIGASLVVETLERLANNTIKPIEQNTIIQNNLKPAPKLTKEFCKIDWNNTAQDICNKIRGLSPYPCASTSVKNTANEIFDLKIFDAEAEIIKHNYNPGTIVSDNKTYLKIATPDGFVWLKDLQRAGKKRLKIDEFLRGNTLTDFTAI